MQLLVRLPNPLARLALLFQPRVCHLGPCWPQWMPQTFILKLMHVVYNPLSYLAPGRHAQRLVHSFRANAIVSGVLDAPLTGLEAQELVSFP